MSEASIGRQEILAYLRCYLKSRETELHSSGIKGLKSNYFSYTDCAIINYY